MILESKAEIEAVIRHRRKTTIKRKEECEECGCHMASENIPFGMFCNRCGFNVSKEWEWTNNES